MRHDYQGLSLACQAFYNKQQVVQALVRSIRNTLLNDYRYDSEDYPDVDSRFTADSPDSNPYWHRVRDNLLGHTTKVGLNREYLAKEFDQVASDIYLIGETKQLAGAEQEATLHLPIDPVLSLELPSVGEVEIGETGEKGEVSELPRDERLIKAVIAYLEQGIHLAQLVYRGEEDYDIEGMDDLNDEEIN